MTPVDSFAGRARAKSAAATDASPGTAVFASPVRAAAAIRATQVSALSIDRSTGSPCVAGQDTTQRRSMIASHRDRLECDALAAHEIDGGGSERVASTPIRFAREVEEPREAAH